MSRAGTIARRTLLIGSVAIAGGVAFGAYMVRRDPANPLAGDLADGSAALTPYVLVTGDGITLVTPRADLGQGAYHLQAALIAEELDVELDQVSVTPGVPSGAYWNEALASEAVPFAFYDEGVAARATRGIAGAVTKLAGLQLTGGSTTVPDAWEKLRLAGASARETLKEAAARRLGVARHALTTEAGEVVAPDGARIPYTDLAAEAARIEPVEWEGLRPPSQWRLIGTPMERIDIVAKSTGQQAYGIDRRMEGMRHGTVVTNPHLGGELISMDAAEAEAMEGVEVVRFANGAGVLAPNTWTAFEAARAIRFEWGPAAIPEEQEEHWRVLSESFTAGRQDSRFREAGDVEAPPEGAQVVEAEYRAPYVAHAPLEPLSAVVLYTDARIDIWTGTQIPRFVQTNVARMTGVDADAIHVHVEVMGGSFGHRLEDDYVQNAVRLAMHVPGTPVKMTYSREEDMAHDFPRQIAMARGRGWAAEGRVEGFDLSIAMPSLTTSQMGRQGLSVPGPDLVIALGAFDQPYAIPSYRQTSYRAPDLAPVSSWRSVGASTNVFFHECLFDELAHAAGADPLEERLRLMDHGPSRDVLEAVAEMCGWSGTRPEDRVGRGIAYGASFGVPVAEVVEVRDTARGIRVERVWVAANVGRVVDPVNFENHVQGGVVWGLGHAMNAEITYEGGAAMQTNYHAHEGMRLHQCPAIEVRGLETNPKVTGVGEPPVPPAAPALANAIFAATGTRLREMPFSKSVTFA